MWACVLDLKKSSLLDTVYLLDSRCMSLGQICWGGEGFCFVSGEFIDETIEATNQVWQTLSLGASWSTAFGRLGWGVDGLRFVSEGIIGESTEAINRMSRHVTSPGFMLYGFWNARVRSSWILFCFWGVHWCINRNNEPVEKQPTHLSRLHVVRLLER